MRMLYKIIITCIVFLFTTKNIYGNTYILPEYKFGIKKISILGAGIFLVVLILYIAYKKDRAEEVYKIEIENLEKEILNKENIKKIYKPYEETHDSITEIQNKKEKSLKEEDLFSSLDLEKKIETLPDFKSPPKKNISLKKEEKTKNSDLKEKKVSGIVSRKAVKIVRERKNRTDKK